METRFQEKPTTEQIERYCRKIEEYLSIHNVSCTVTLNDFSSIVSFSVNNTISKEHKLWIDKILISTPQIEKLEVHPNRFGIDDTLTEHEIWKDAWIIQNQLYTHQGCVTVDVPYWELWKHLKNINMKKNNKKECPECLSLNVTETGSGIGKVVNYYPGDLNLNIPLDLEYECKECTQNFVVVEYPVCPKCNSENIKQSDTVAHIKHEGEPAHSGPEAVYYHCWDCENDWKRMVDL